MTGVRASAGRLAVLSLLIAGAAAGGARAQPPPTSAQDYVAASAGSELYEVMAARVALIQSHDQAVRAFAQEMIHDHDATLADLRLAATRSGLKPPPETVGADQAALLGALQSLRGVDFDRAYASQQVVAHAGALATQRAYASNGGNISLKAIARSETPMIERHLAAARALRPPGRD